MNRETPILIHIGFHKTGTTWLQNNLFVSGHEIFEPISDFDSGQSSFAYNFYCDQNGQLLSSFDYNEEYIIEELKRISEQKREKLDNKIPVISRERLSGHPSSGGFDANMICERLSRIFKNAKILIVTREQKSAIMSNFFHHLHEGGNFSISKYLHTGYDGFRPYFSLNYLRYDLIVRKYQEVFGKDNVLVLPYELFRESSGKFLTEIGDFVGRELDVLKSNAEERININKHPFVKYHLRSLYTLQRKNSINNYNSFSNPFTGFLARLIVKLLGTITPNFVDDWFKKRVKLEIDKAISDYYASGNERLSALTGRNFGQFGYLSK